MSATCASVRDRIPAYVDDRLSAADVRAFREHVSGCRGCRHALVTAEPSLLFARPVAEPVSAEDVAAVLAGVRAGLVLKETEGRLAPRGVRRVGAVASAAALAALVLLLPGSGRRPEPGFPVAAPGAGSAPSTGFAPAGAAAEPASADGTFPEDATIYDWNPGASIDEPRVVWIVDRSLDI